MIVSIEIVDFFIIERKDRDTSDHQCIEQMPSTTPRGQDKVIKFGKVNKIVDDGIMILF